MPLTTPSRPRRATRRPRDRQRSAVYRWERSLGMGCNAAPDFLTLEECQAWMDPIWRAERGRYGLARRQPPEIRRPTLGQTSALAFHGYMKLPRWARSRAVVLHEMAHCLTPFDEGHGPRFVGVFMGLLARHAGWNIDHLTDSALAAGIDFRWNSIGAVPMTTTQLVTNVLRREPPMSLMDLAFTLDVRYRSVWGAVMGMIARGQARLLRGKVVLANDPAACERPAANETLWLRQA